MKQIYLDNAATSFPKPTNVRNAVNNSFIKFCANPGRGGYEMAQMTAGEIYKTRLKLCKFFGFDKPENVCFTKSCTEAVNLVLNSVLETGDHVVISDLEHNCVVRCVHELSKRGVSYSVFTTYDNDDETLNSLRKAINSKTKLMVCTGASNVFGLTLPLSRLCALCKIYDIQTCVDSAQLAGHKSIHMKNQCIDYLCVPSHKGLYGIMGGGALLCEDSLKPFIFGGTGTSSMEYDMPEFLPERLEAGTLNVPAIISMSAGIDFINSIGLEKMARSEMLKIAKIYNNFTQNEQIELYIKMQSQIDYVPVLSFNIKAMDSEEVSQKLSQNGIAVRAGLHCAPLAHKKFGTVNGTVRVSPSVFSTENDINMFIYTTQSIIKSKNLKKL